MINNDEDYKSYICTLPLDRLESIKYSINAEKLPERYKMICEQIDYLSHKPKDESIPKCEKKNFWIKISQKIISEETAIEVINNSYKALLYLILLSSILIIILLIKQDIELALTLLISTIALIILSWGIKKLRSRCLAIFLFINFFSLILFQAISSINEHKYSGNLSIKIFCLYFSFRIIQATVFIHKDTKIIKKNLISQALIFLGYLLGLYLLMGLLVFLYFKGISDEMFNSIFVLGFVLLIILTVLQKIPFTKREIIEKTDLLFSNN